MLTRISTMPWDRLLQVCQIIRSEAVLCEVYIDTRSGIFIAESGEPRNYYKIPAHNETVETLLRELLPDVTLPLSLPRSQRRILSSTFSLEFERLGSFEFVLDMAESDSDEVNNGS
jgi:hypothetical protein